MFRLWRNKTDYTLGDREKLLIQSSSSKFSSSIFSLAMFECLLSFKDHLLLCFPYQFSEKNVNFCELFPIVYFAECKNWLWRVKMKRKKSKKCWKTHVWLTGSQHQLWHKLEFIFISILSPEPFSVSQLNTSFWTNWLRPIEKFFFVFYSISVCLSRLSKTEKIVLQVFMLI
jgi:hypothetical protein